MRLVVAMLALALAGAVPARAQSGVYTFKFTNNTSYTVYVKLFSKTRNWTWPNSGTSWVLNDRGEHSIRISCNVGEKICYGGSWSNRARSWGLGLDGTLGCSGCCIDCGTQGQNWSYGWSLVN